MGVPLPPRPTRSAITIAIAEMALEETSGFVVATEYPREFGNSQGISLLRGISVDVERFSSRKLHPSNARSSEERATLSDRRRLSAGVSDSQRPPTTISRGQRPSEGRRIRHFKYVFFDVDELQSR